MLNPKKITKYLLAIIITASFLINTPALAFSFKDSFNKEGSLSTLAQQSGYEKDPIAVEGYVGIILTAFFSLLGIIAIALIIYSGFTWMTARGNEAQVTKAKDNLFTVIIGLIFIIGGYALTIFLLRIFN